VNFLVSKTIAGQLLYNAETQVIDHQKFEELKAFEIKPNDILISCSGTIGRVAIVPEDAEEGIINQALLKITLDSSIMLPEFFKIVFESDLIKEEVARLSPGSAMKNITSMKELKKVVFAVPFLPEQRRIVAYFDSLQAKVDELERLQAETEKEIEELVPSILDKAFKGEL
jgi:type I restriction enzyme S subunit